MFSRKLQELRKERNISQKELARLSGVSQSFISELENNRKVPTLGIVYKLAYGLNCDVKDLISVYDSRDSNKKQFQVALRSSDLRPLKRIPQPEHARMKNHHA